MLTPGLETLQRITAFLNEELKGKDTSNMLITFQVDEKTLNRINEDLFYRNNLENENKKCEYTDEINVNIGGIRYRYIKREEY